MVELVYKICSRSAWLEAQRRGCLEWSPDDHRDGFTHLSTRDQLPGTLARHFAGQSDLVLLEVPVAALDAPSLKWETSRGGQLFPHLYARLPSQAVVRVLSVGSESSGQRLPPEL